MILAQIHEGRIEAQDPIPASWEGQTVSIMPLTPDEPLPDLEERLADLHRRGAAEFEPGERERIQTQLDELNRISAGDLFEIGGGES